MFRKKAYRAADVKRVDVAGCCPKFLARIPAVRCATAG